MTTAHMINKYSSHKIHTRSKVIVRISLCILFSARKDLPNRNWQFACPSVQPIHTAVYLNSFRNRGTKNISADGKFEQTLLCRATSHETASREWTNRSASICKITAQRRIHFGIVSEKCFNWQWLRSRKSCFSDWAVWSSRKYICQTIQEFSDQRGSMRHSFSCQPNRERTSLLRMILLFSQIQIETVTHRSGEESFEKSIRWVLLVQFLWSR